MPALAARWSPRSAPPTVSRVIRTTPFHERLKALDSQGLYTHWQGRLSALRYSPAPKHEYFAVRSSVGVFDTSPLSKYRIEGPDAERFLAGVLVRDIRACPPGRGQYTLWCDDRGFVMEDGVVLRHSPTEFVLTAARPNHGRLTDLAGRLRVRVEDVSDASGMLAVQGPRSRTVLAGLAPEVAALPVFAHTPTSVAGVPVTVSRTGYTGDLGYEVTVPADGALDVLDAVLEAGRDHGLRPFGEEALMVLRIEAGLPLLDVEWTNSRLAFTDEQRVTPSELGMGWMLRGVEDPTRPFVGRDAIRHELATGGSRWATVGLVVDPADWERLHRDAGLLPPVHEHPLPYESLLYDAPTRDHQIGYVTSLVYSPVLQRHVGLARVRPELASPGTRLQLEVAVHHGTTTVRACTATLPLFDPPRRTARHD